MLEMVPRLEAEEAMTAATSTSIGTKLRAGRQQWHAWQRAARPRRAEGRRSPSSLGALGVGFRTVQKAG